MSTLKWEQVHVPISSYLLSSNLDMPVFLKFNVQNWIHHSAFQTRVPFLTKWPFYLPHYSCQKSSFFCTSPYAIFKQILFSLLSICGSNTSLSPFPYFTASRSHLEYNLNFLKILMIHCKSYCCLPFQLRRPPL